MNVMTVANARKVKLALTELCSGLISYVYRLVDDQSETVIHSL